MTNGCVAACRLHARTSADVCECVPVCAHTPQRVWMYLLVCHMMSCGNS